MSQEKSDPIPIPGVGTIRTRGEVRLGPGTGQYDYTPGPSDPTMLDSRPTVPVPTTLEEVRALVRTIWGTGVIIEGRYCRVCHADLAPKEYAESYDPANSGYAMDRQAARGCPPMNHGGHRQGCPAVALRGWLFGDTTARSEDP